MSLGLRRAHAPTVTGRPRGIRGRLIGAGSIALMMIPFALAAPHLPASDAQVLAEVPAGARHATAPATMIAGRLDIALPLAQFDISRARATGDLRFLGYAEAVLSPWMAQAVVPPQVLILHATILQSRHAFNASLLELDRALKARPDDAQGWLTRATVLRVLGRYEEAMLSCQRMAAGADPAVTGICIQSLRGLTGHLQSAYADLTAISSQDLAPEARAWRYSELGEMAARLGNDAAAEHWFRAGLQAAPQDFYIRSACADVLLRQGRAAETLQLLSGYESVEPMLLRVAIAHSELGDGAGLQANNQLSAAFDVEERRGDAVHRREQARFLLDIVKRPADALTAAQENWKEQREPDDLLILLRAARALHRPEAAGDAERFLKQTGLEDSRLAAYRDAPS